MNQNTGIRFLRYTMGSIFVLHGLMKVAGGIGTLTYIGGMPPLAPHNNPHLQLGLGIIAAAFEILGGLGVITGIGFRYACSMIIIAMLAACSYHITQVHDFESLMTNTWPLEDLFVFLSLLIIGPGTSEKKA
jgi:uncharacterized membrane protein YphA (DoxX/SURF4 family)